uniref:Uncharacterized protein n=1 Tax=Anguilla anguilla TaxID=7936 RepID=A0A0E9V1G8_ANGAN
MPAAPAFQKTGTAKSIPYHKSFFDLAQKDFFVFSCLFLQATPTNWQEVWCLYGSFVVLF